MTASLVIPLAPAPPPCTLELIAPRPATIGIGLIIRASA